MINLNIRSKKCFMFIICTILSAVLLPVCAFAKTPAASGGSSSLTIVCKDKGTHLEGITYDLYKITDTDDKGGFSLTKEFENYSISLEQDSAEDIRALAKTLSLYAVRDEIPAVSQAKTEKNGKALFRNLSAGLYLAYGHKYTDKEKDFTYTPEPILVNLKKAGSPDSPFHDITVNSKGGKFTITNTYIPLEPPAESEGNPPPAHTPPTNYPDLPHTGQLWWPIPILILSGLLFYAAGFVVNNKTKNDD